GMTFTAERAERVSSPHVSKGSTLSGDQRGALTHVRATDTERATDTAGTFAPVDLLDYIYAVLHSPKYRERYKEFLKIDFPRVPYPTKRDTFWRLVALGGELRQLHLLESPRVEEFITGFNVAGSNLVDKPVFKSPGPHAASPLDVRNRSGVPGTLAGSDARTDAFPADSPPDSGSAAASERRHSRKENMEADGEAELRRTSGGKAGAGGTPALQSGDVFINPMQYFANVPKVAWDFYIGGYQPAQKWLKDRKGRTLSYEDIRHYQKMIVALTETARVMSKIDEAWRPEGESESSGQ
ncbi:MAG: hypothetical protein KBD94_11435, partial [Pyrinomonadaceae bacterium]|nr:hypothetical protein [Pyrinomonadaceae bacterium]